ncbi:unnamed protein product [Nippostrongylus brasiliensis]|uniref:Glutathione S-transferase omega n=1 Tax=Nippostrongylus brasiliensis TaxID=27835 RepID=A0A0N4YQ99_NIPBR|nr:unnamed protein product [Nippostrongylus brasiliensis]
MRFCPWCERVLLTLARKNVSVEIVNVNLIDKPSFLLEMHPEGKVPVLEHHHQTIIDSALIAEYLDWVYPESSVLPNDPYERARQRMIASLIEAKMPTAVHAIINEQRSPSQKVLTLKMMRDALKGAEKLLDTDTFYGGKEPSFADYMTYPFVERIWIWTHEVQIATQPLSRHRLFNQGYITGNPDFDAGVNFRRIH